MSHHILVVEDEPATRSMLTRMLENAGFRVSAAETAAEARAGVIADRPDLVILDLNLPDEQDLGLARDLCGRPEFATIIVTARAEDLDRVAGLELGADDYVAKPFFPRELVARINGVLRRLNGVVARAAETAGVLRFDGWKLDLNAHSLINPAGKSVPLTRAEFSLLAALMVRPGKPQSREQLLEAVSHRDWLPVDRTVDVLVSRLRRKIEENPRVPRYIVTLPGTGYKFMGTVES
jgi:DNA-binding response OmpR family regulator